MNCLDLSCPFEITECCPSHSGEVAYHTEIIIDGELHIPEVKPSCEKVINVTRKICLTKVVPVPVKLDNGCLAGYKILVVGTIRLGIEYSAKVPEQNVHFVHFDVPFQGLITGNPCHRPIPLTDCNLKKFDLRVCVEHLEVQQVSLRSFEKVVVLLFWLQHKKCNRPDPCEQGQDTKDTPNVVRHNYQSDSQPKGTNDVRPDYNIRDCNTPDYNSMECKEAANCHQPTCNPALCNSTSGVAKQTPGNDSWCTPVSRVSKQISINDTLIIPPQKPPAECLLNSSVDIDICKAEIIKTPLTDHCQRQIMKVVVTGKAHITVKYVANVPEQQVHAAIFRVPFEALIEWPGGPPEHTPVCVSVTVEHFQVDMLDQRRLFLVLILRLDTVKK